MRSPETKASGTDPYRERSLCECLDRKHYGRLPLVTLRHTRRYQLRRKRSEGARLFWG